MPGEKREFTSIAEMTGLAEDIRNGKYGEYNPYYLKTKMTEPKLRDSRAATICRAYGEVLDEIIDFLCCIIGREGTPAPSSTLGKVRAEEIERIRNEELAKRMEESEERAMAAMSTGCRIM